MAARDRIATRVALAAAVMAGLAVAAGPPEGPAAAQSGAAGLLITEVYYDTPGRDEDEEWIEIANLGSAAIDLGGYGLGDEESPGGAEGMARFPAGTVVQPGQVVIVAQTAAGYRSLFGANPDMELRPSDDAVPDLIPDSGWATGQLALNNDGDEVLLVTSGGAIADAVSFGDGGRGVAGGFALPAVGDVPRGQSIERRPAGCDSNTATDWQGQPEPNPGALSFEGECRRPLGPSASSRPIGQVQGAGDSSPLINQFVTVRGVVTAVVEDQNAEGTRFYSFYLQDLPETADGDPDTSDGLAVFAGARRPPVAEGDVVLVTGRVQEFYGLTELDNNGLQVQIERRNAPPPEPLALPAPNDSARWAAELEPYEGMRVTWPNAVVVGPTHAGCGFTVAPAAAALAQPIMHRADETEPPLLGVIHTSDVACGGFPMVGTGDTVEPLVGPLTYRFEQYAIVFTPNGQEYAITSASRPWPGAVPAAAEGQLSVATFNLQDYLAEVNDVPGALALKQAKLAHAIGETLACPAVIGVQEAQDRQLLSELGLAAAERCGFVYRATLIEGPDGRGIDVGLLTDPARAQLISWRAHQSCTALTTDVSDPLADCAPGDSPLFGRPPLEVELLWGREPITVFVNHFKSKRDGEAETAPIRLAEAAALRAWAEQALARRPAAQLIVLGDFNDYDRSAVADALTGDDLLASALEGVPESERYTYIFGGRRQLLDWILVSPDLLDRVASATIAHVNADHPYSLATAISAGSLPFRSSDHDIPVVIFAAAQPPPTPMPRPTATPTVAPTMVPTLEPATATPTSRPTITPTATPAALPAEEPTAANDWLGVPAVLLLLGIGLAVSRLTGRGRRSRP